MPEFLGMDVDEVQHLSISLRQAATDIEAIVRSLDFEIESTRWVGMDASNFRKSWEAERSLIYRSIQFLSDASTIAQANIVQQQNASS